MNRSRFTCTVTTSSERSSRERRPRSRSRLTLRGGSRSRTTSQRKCWACSSYSLARYDCPRARRLEPFLQVQPVLDVKEVPCKQRSLPGDLFVPFTFVEPERGEVVAADVEADGRLVRVPGEFLSSQEQAASHPLAPEIRGDDEALDVCLR